MGKHKWLMIILVLFIAAGTAYGAGKSSAELGQELFNDPQFGSSTNDSACSSCHAEGKGLENAMGKKKLSKLINSCLVDKMGGEKLDGRTVSMRSLKMYMKTLHN
jgi:cytochrome c peroxidase